MSERAHQLRQALVVRLLAGPGTATPEARRAAFEGHAFDGRTDALLDGVTRAAWTVRDADVTAPLQAGLSEDQVFELVVCAAVGQATRQLETAMAALDRAAQAAEGQSCG